MTRFSITSLSLCFMLATSSSIFSADSEDVGTQAIKAPRIIPVDELLEGLGLSMVQNLSGSESEDEEPSQGATSEISQRRFHFSSPNTPFHKMKGEDWRDFNNLLMEYNQEAADLSRECVESIQKASTFRVHNKLVHSTGVRGGRVVDTRKLEKKNIYDKEKLMAGLRFAFDKLYDYTKKIDQVSCAIRGDLLGAAETDSICTGLDDLRCIFPSEGFDFIAGSESVKTKELLQDGEKCIRILKRVWQLVFVKHFYHKILYHNVGQGFGSDALSRYLHDNPGLDPQQLYLGIEDVNGYKNKIVEDNLTLWDRAYTCITTPELIQPFDGRVTIQYFRKFSGLELEMKKVQDEFLIPYGSLLNEINHADQLIIWLKRGNGLITEENRGKLLRILRFFAEQKRATVGKVIIAADSNKALLQRNITKISEIMKDSPEVAADLKKFLLSLYREVFSGQKMIPMEGASGVANMLRVLAHACGIRGEGLLSIYLASRENKTFFCDGLLGDMKFLISHGEEFAKTLSPDLSRDAFWQWISLYKEGKEKKINDFQAAYKANELLSKLHSTYVVRANEAMFTEIIKHNLEEFVRKYEFFKEQGFPILEKLISVTQSPSQEQVSDVVENSPHTGEDQAASTAASGSLIQREEEDKLPGMSNSEFETSLLFTIRQISSERTSLNEKIAKQTQVIEDLIGQRDDLQGRLLEVSEGLDGSSRTIEDLTTSMNRLKGDLKKQDSRIQQLEKDKRRQEETHASQIQSIEDKKQEEAKRYQKRIQQKAEALTAEREKSQALMQERDDALVRIETTRKRAAATEAQLKESRSKERSMQDQSAKTKEEVTALREQLSLAAKEAAGAKEASSKREAEFRTAWDAREREIQQLMVSAQYQATETVALEHQSRESALLLRIAEMERAMQEKEDQMRAQQRQYAALQQALKYHRNRDAIETTAAQTLSETSEKKDVIPQ